MGILLVFIDGLGLGPPGSHNPLTWASTPALETLIGGKLLSSTDFHRGIGLCRGVDAGLGVPGIPQSATGQTTLFTGVNAARLCGYHMPAYPDAVLLDLLHRESIFLKAVKLGRRVTFANGYDLERYELMLALGKLRHSASTIAMEAAGIPKRTLQDLVEGRAVYWDLDNSSLAARGREVPVISPEAAGENLARLCNDHDLVLYETFKTDLLGHRNDLPAAITFLESLDRFLQGLLDCLPHGTTLVITSDHGNIEDLSWGSHTENQIPVIVFGPEESKFKDIVSLADVPAGILSALQHQ